MPFGFTKTHEIFQRETRRFLQKEIAPGAKERAKLKSIPPEIWKKVADQGLLRVNVPAEYGGQPADWITVGILLEEVARVDIALFHPIITAVMGHYAFRHASKELLQEWLPKVLSGQKRLCAGITEPGAGSDVAGMKTRAVRDGDEWVLTGEKLPVTGGMDSDIALFHAVIDPEKGRKGLGSFFVPLNLPGITRTPFPSMGFHQVDFASVVMDGVRLPAGYRVDASASSTSDQHAGFYDTMEAFGRARTYVGLIAVGAAQAQLEETIEYVKQRTAFGRPIARFQGVSFRIAEHATKLEAARLLCYHALWLWDQGAPTNKEAAMAKWYPVVVAVESLNACLHTHGFAGYTEAMGIEQRLRDVIGLQIGDGTADIQKIVIGNEIIGREFRTY